MTDTHTENVTRFDLADYLDTIGDVAVFLQVAMENAADDPSELPYALGVIARTGNMSELARRVGMSRDGLSKAFSPDGNPTWATLYKVASALGLEFTLKPAATAPESRPAIRPVAAV